MPRKGVTGHDEWVIAQALATALVALERLPPKVQPKPHKKLLMAGKLPTRLCEPASGPGKVQAIPRKRPAVHLSGMGGQK
jgi:hypothetical protein